MKMFVYGLFDASDKDQSIFYVGLTSNLKQRRQNHRGHKKRHVGNFIKQLHANGSDFSIKVLEETDETNGHKVESWWIAELKPKLNFQLSPRSVNVTDKIIFVPQVNIEYGGTLAELERQVISQVLAGCNGNKMLAAEVLGIGRQTLYNKIARHKIECAL